jgi:hydrogenase maturation protein HypF
VQGVGFRPFIYRLAGELGLAGVVGNHSHGAFIELEGRLRSIERFLGRLYKELPPLAKITYLHVAPLEVQGDPDFRIDASVVEQEQDAEVTPDVTVCADCLAELFDPADRRYRYPFINCTNCGPRYSIIRGVPYDRPNTTMSSFKMCPACQAEYDNPTDRRFHAQPNACSSCGPRVWLTDAHGVEVKDDAVHLGARKLVDGQIIAIKGIGGFHLACRADNDAVVERLRSRKSREAKPFALMVSSLAEARKLAEIDQPAADIMSSAARPIVLVPKKRSHSISECVAPGSDYFGIMLPYTPLHHLLFAEGLGPLVMTSGNPNEEPLCCDNAEALARLSGIADGFLLHDRDIERRVDDSVVMAGGAIPCAMPIRRSRGYAPSPIRLCS